MKKIFPLLILVLISFASCGGDPKNVIISVDAPLTIQQGEEFIIVARVENTDSKEQSIASLDIDSSYLEGIAIVRTEPDHSEVSNIPLVDMVSYSFDIPIEGGEVGEVKFYAEALRSGDYQGDIDFCINTDYSFLTKSLRTVVESSSSGKK